MRGAHVARSLLLLLVVFLAAACGGRKTADAGDERATLSVTNNHWSDINVYLLRNGARFRLGMVTAATQRQFVLPRQATAGAADVRLLADPIGSRRTYTSPSVYVVPGQQVVWTIANQLSLSSLSIQRGAVY
jgi:hypothetical protein